MKLITEDDASAIQVLSDRLTEFYANTRDYDAFEAESWHPVLWSQMAPRFQSLPAGKTLRILELGAGRSGLARYLSDQPGWRARAHLTCQDITSQNADHLRAGADEVHLGPLEELHGQWDVITHAYVLEHITRPRAFLSQAFNRLSPNGLQLIQCPRYDLPFYTPPALDHLHCSTRLRFNLRRLGSRRAFEIMADPALFHLPFQRDRDAVHLVSSREITRLHDGFAHVESFDLPAGGWRDWIVKNLLTLRLRITRTSDQSMPIPGEQIPETRMPSIESH